MPNQYQPLFLKYRPQALNELVGQNQVLVTLSNAIKHDRISHAYLFTGPRGTGKTSAARIFAKSLNCQEGPTVNPCQTCTACLEIKQGISPAVFEIDAASNNSVDDARLLIERAPLSACGGRYKFYIIDECHMLSKEAFNALLKTIEEPPANVIFVLATTEEYKVPATIVSRCQKLIFRLIGEGVMASHLAQIAEKENMTIESEAITTVARRANGGLRDALSLLDQVSLLGADGQAICTEDVLLLAGALSEDNLLSISEQILKEHGDKTLSLLQNLLAEGREPHLIAGELAKHMLNVAKSSYATKDELDNITGSIKYKTGLIEQAKLIDRGQLIQMIEELDRLEISCRRSTQPIINLEIGLLSLCHRLDIIELKSIQSRLEKLENGMPVKNIASQQPKDVVSESKNTAPVITPEQKDHKTTPPLEPSLVAVPVQAQAKILAQSPAQAAAPAQIQAQDNPILPPPQDSPSTTTPGWQEEPQSDQTINQTNNLSNPDLEIIWQNMLIDLQRRHLPSFSLVSTHAFPVSLIDNTLTIGVLVENFQKMIENKIEHIKVSAIACQLNPNLNIRVKVIAEGTGNRAARAETKANDSSAKLNQEIKEETQPSTARHLISSSNKGQNDITGPIGSGKEKQNQTAVQEAYRLFEGPGSRFIAPNQ